MNETDEAMSLTSYLWYHFSLDSINTLLQETYDKSAKQILLDVVLL